MPGPTRLIKAKLQELDKDFKNTINDDRTVQVQFNPETLKVSFANQITTPDSAGDQKGTPARQFVGAGTTKLSLQLWFDVNAELPEGSQQETDVRKLTQRVAYFITPRADEKDSTKLIPPAVRFLWGSFQFDGILDSLEESLEFFSSDGIPLRASMSLNISQQKIQDYAFGKASITPPPGTGGPGGAAPGTQPLAQAPSGATLQGMAASAGNSDWQSVALANGIENPRLLQPGQLINLNVKVPSSQG